MSKSKKVIFRVSEDMFSFLQEFAQSVRMERSELMRRIVENHFLLYFSNSQQESYEELKNRFLSLSTEQEGISQGKS